MLCVGAPVLFTTQCWGVCVWGAVKETVGGLVLTPAPASQRGRSHAAAALRYHSLHTTSY